MSEGNPQKPNGGTESASVPKRSWMRWILPVVALAVLVALGSILKSRLHEDVWAFYTDDEGLKVDAKAKKQRMVLWEDPRERVFEEQPLDPNNPEATDSINQSSERVEAAFLADGAMMVLTRLSKDFEKTERIVSGSHSPVSPAAPLP